MPATVPRLSWEQKLTYALGNVPVIVPAMVVGQWLMYFYAGTGDAERPARASVAVISALGFLGALANALLNPVIGYLSDRRVTRFGRRLPWLAVTGPLLAVVFTVLWFPPYRGEHPGNTSFAAALVVLFYVLYVAYAAPYLALLPEIAVEESERVFLSMLQGLFEVLGNLFAMALVPLVISRFQPSAGQRGGLELGPLRLVDGYQVMGALVGGVVLVAALLQLCNVRERGTREQTPSSLGFGPALRETFRNPAFLPYVVSQSFYRLCLMMVIIASPYLVTLVMGGREEHLGPLMGCIVVGAAVLFPVTLKLTRRMGMRRLFLAALLTFGAALPLVALVGDLPGIGHQPFFGRWLHPLVEGMLPGHAPSEPFLHAGALFLIIAAPVSVFMILPHALLAEIIDEDERRTGYRREAMYNGVEGLLTTTGWGAAYLVNGGLLRLWDVKQHQSLGVLMVFPLAGAFMLLAGAIFWRYPLGRPATRLEAGR